MNSFQIIGLMSGTSMDGIDVALCEFRKDNNSWTHRIISCDSKPYPDTLLQKLRDSKSFSAVELLLLDKELGRHFAEQTNHFITTHRIDRSTIHAIASHGHTIFHQPENGFTYQIGCGDTFSYHTGIPVINDFRQKDVVAGGQGAPLVPIGDLLLFSGKADAFLNIGGFANITFINDRVKAFDICPGNLPLNRYAGELGKMYDPNGELARSGEVNHSVLERLNSLDFYKKRAPKSLGTEWLEEVYYQCIPESLTPQIKLRTCTEHISEQIANVINDQGSKQVMVTGGGAYNTFLIDRIKEKSSANIYLPDKQLIEFKEAIVFAFLGALYLSDETNTLPSVTGAVKATIGGTLHKP